MRYLYVSFLILFFPNIFLFAQAPKSSKIFQHITSDNGLQNNNVYCLIQDTYGFLWIGTENGLHKYDGINVTLYEHDPSDKSSIAGNVIFKLLEDNDKNLWICTNAGLDKYDPFKDKFIHVPERTGSEMNYGLYIPAGIVDRRGDIYVGEGTNGIYKLNKDSLCLKKLSIIDNEGKLIDMGIITSMYQSKDGLLWCGSKNKGIFSVDLNNYVATPYSVTNKGINSNIIYSIFQDQQGNLFGGADNGLYQWNSLKKQFELIDRRSIYAISEDSEGNLWFGANGSGLLIRQKGSELMDNFQSIEGNENSLNSNSVRAIYEDRQHNMWLGTFQGGLNYILRNNSDVFKTIHKNSHSENSLSYNSVDAIMEDKDGDIWLGTDGGGINFFDNKSDKYYHYDDNGKIKSVLTLYEDDDGFIWFGGYLEGLGKFNKKTEKFYRYKNSLKDSFSLANDDVRCILEDSQKNFWVATNGGGVNKLDKVSGKFTRLAVEDGIASNYCITLFEDSKKRLWVGTYGGLSISDLQRKSFKTYKSGSKNSLSSNWIYCIYEDTRGRFWIGTDYGLNLFDEANGKFVSFFKKDGLPNNVIAGILEDKNGNIWISTNGGISQMDPDKMLFRNFSSKDGLQGNHFNHGSFLKTKNGLFYFGGTDGLTWFNPDEIRLNNEAPPVCITTLNLNNESKVINAFSGKGIGKVSLSYEEAGVVIFKFIALNFINPEKNKYKYFLEGFDANWRDGEHDVSATYTNLDPGTYTFHVKACNNDGIWNENDAKVLITIHPPLYRSVWAYILYFLVLVGLCIFFIRYAIIKVKYRRDIEIEKVKREKSEELIKIKNDFFTSISHELGTPVTLILTPLQQMKDSQVFDKRLMDISWNNAKRLQNLIEELLNFQKTEEGKEQLFLAKTEIRSFVLPIVENFKELFARKGIHLETVINIPLVEIYIDTGKLEKVIYNLISNAYKYTPSGGAVTVELSINKPIEDQELNIDDSFCISVKDTGIGVAPEKINSLFDKYFRINQNDKDVNGYGIGLYLTKTLVGLHKGKIYVKSEEGKGSEFIVVIPSNLKPLVVNGDKSIKQELVNAKITEAEEPDYNGRDSEETAKELRPTILIAEDNEELIIVLENILSADYSLIKASDGLKALKLATMKLPDLIITDIMMPQLDGMDLCERIKADFNTCHIPVIMLTALNTDEHKLKGLDLGADDYISKPFNSRILLSRVKNLIESRKLLHKKFISDLNVNPGEITVTSADEIFLRDSIAIVEKNIENPMFDVDQFSKEMSMSESTLYRKIKALTSQSPNQFIRTIRLKRAAQLFEKSNSNVSEVCYMVGFSDVKYFRKCFQKQFGVSPGQYRKEENL